MTDCRQRPDSRGRPAGRLPERARGDPDGRQGAADRDARRRRACARLEVTSFVRADVIPQLADAEQVLDAVERPDGSRLLGADPERAGARAGARPPRALRRGEPLPLRLRDPQPQERQPLDRRVARRASSATIERARAEGLRCEGVISVSFGCPYEGEVPPDARARDRRAARRGGLRGGRLRRHHRDGEPAPGRASSSPPRRERLAGVELTAHFHNTRGQGLANVLAALERGGRLVRVRVRRARRLPGPARVDGQHLDRGPRLDARGDGRRDRRRPRELIDASRAVQELLGRPLGAHVLRAGPVEWSLEASDRLRLSDIA